jgi:hypothetical protein
MSRAAYGPPFYVIPRLEQIALIDAAFGAALDERGRRGPKGVRKDARLSTGFGPRLQRTPAPEIG